MLSKYLSLAVGILALLSTPVWSTQQPLAAKSLTVNQLAAKPDAYVGQVAVVGRVAAATKGKGFTLIDSSQCSTCATDCLTDKTTKKIPFIWNGAVPVVKDVVRVDGTLAKTAKGYTFTAERVTKQ
jgi:hypothetical protein